MSDAQFSDLIPSLNPNPCPGCGINIDTPALAFLHAAVHSEPDVGRRDPSNLRRMPYVLMPRVARLMQDYADSRRNDVTTDGATPGKVAGVDLGYIPGKERRCGITILLDRPFAERDRWPMNMVVLVLPAPHLDEPFDG